MMLTTLFGTLVLALAPQDAAVENPIVVLAEEAKVHFPVETERWAYLMSEQWSQVSGNLSWRSSERAEEKLLGWISVFSGEIASLEARIQDVKKEVDSRERRLAELDSQLSSLKKQRVSFDQAGLDAMRRTLRFSKMEAEVRQMALEKNAVKLEARLKTAVDSDVAIIGLRKAIQTLEDISQSSGGSNEPGPTAELRVELGLKLAELNIELANRIDLVRSRSGATLLQEIQAQLLNLDVELEVMDAKHRVIEQEHEDFLRVRNEMSVLAEARNAVAVSIEELGTHEWSRRKRELESRVSDCRSKLGELRLERSKK